MAAEQSTLHDPLLDPLRAAVGAEHVNTDPDDIDFFSMDVYRQREKPLAVVSPGSVGELSEVVAAATQHGVAVVPRGGGASYTDGYLPAVAKSITLDTSRLNQILEINATDMYVVVQSGVTWFELSQALEEQGLRTPFWGPFSGLKATVGGSMSQNSASMGTSAYGISADSVLGMQVVLGDGQIVTTGAAALKTSSPFFRHYGPDLTGVFTGDAGAMGIKATVALRLIQRPKYREAMSFGFASFEAMSQAMAAAARTGMAADNWGLDPELQSGQMGRVKTSDALKAAASVFKSSRNPIDGLVRVAKIGVAGKRFIQGYPYSAHYLVEGQTSGELKGRMATVRSAIGSYGQEIANTIPAVMGAQPFMPMYPVLGPRGQRWVPQHGIVPFSRMGALYDALQVVYERHAAAMERLKMTYGAMFMTISTHAFLYEPVLYWEDSRTPFHSRFMPKDYLATLPEYPESPEGRALAAKIRDDIQDVFHEHGAIHMQVGKSYPYLRGREKTATALLKGIKASVDPDNLINPGALQLGFGDSGDQ